MLIDTFSANSLKILDKSLDEFQNKYVYNLSLFKKDKRAQLGQKFHSLICSYIKGFDIKKLLLNLDDTELNYWNKLEEILKLKKQYFIKTEYPFLIKDILQSGANYYLTGRFDAIYFENEIYTIYDWKTLNLPKDVENDLQSVVYLYCASKIFNTDKIKMKYLSVEKLEVSEVEFKNMAAYKERLDGIIEKVL